MSAVPDARRSSGLRRVLDGLYDGAAALAALAMIGLLAMVLLAIVSRQLHFHVQGTDAYAGYLMAAAGFLALAHTLKRGEHIRVSLLLEHSPPRVRTALDRGSLAIGAALAALFAYYSVRLAWQSWKFHDISTASDATPLWLPQLSMALGAVILLVALIDELLLEWRGQRRAVESAELLRNE